MGAHVAELPAGHPRDARLATKDDRGAVGEAKTDTDIAADEEADNDEDVSRRRMTGYYCTD